MSQSGFSRQTVITLLPSGLEVSHRGRSQHIELDPAAWDQSWREQLKPLDATLTSALARLGVKQGHAVVVYHSPELLSDVVPVGSTGGDALDAAMLAVAQSASGSGLRLDVAQALAQDTQSKRLHVLAASDSVAAAEMLAAWLGRAGISPAGLIPARSAAIHRAATLALNSNDPNALVVCVGESGSGIAAGASGRLAFARAMDFGLSQVVAVYLSALKREPAGAAERAAARELALRFGVPERESVIDPATDLTGARLLPLLQPVLQRALVDLKQTLRFGLPAGATRDAKIVLDGHAATLPGLQELISTQLDCATTLNSKQGWEATWASHIRSLAITPPTVLDRRTNSRFGRALAAGLALAASVILADAVHTRGKIETVRQSSAAIGPQVRDIEDRMLLIDRTGKLAEQVRRTQTELAESLNNRAPIRAILFEVTRLTPDGVQLAEVSWSPPPTHPSPEYAASLTLRGHAPKAAGHDSLGQLIDDLKACPMVSSVAIGSTRTLSHETGTFQQFTITAKIRGVPHASLQSLAGAAK